MIFYLENDNIEYIYIYINDFIIIGIAFNVYSHGDDCLIKNNSSIKLYDFMQELLSMIFFLVYQALNGVICISLCSVYVTKCMMMWLCDCV